jgi:hypothetical protein
MAYGEKGPVPNQESILPLVEGRHVKKGKRLSRFYREVVIALRMAAGFVIGS